MTASPLLHRIVILVLFTTICAFYCAAIRPGHDWDDDFAMYILHARNLAEGRAYADTGYIFNPEYPLLGPASYPPGFPILLAPVWALRGLDLTALKLVGIACFAGALAFVFCLDRAFSGSCLSPSARIVLVSLAALSPPFVVHVNFMGSDFPFLLFLFAALFLMDRIYSHPNPPLISALPVTALMLAAYSTRAIGLVLIPSLILFVLIRHRRISLSALLASALAGILFALEFLASDSLNSSSLFRLDGHTIATNLWIYAVTLRHFFAGERTLSLVLWGVCTVLASIQFLRQAASAKQVPIGWIFGLLYMLVLLVYQPNEPRFLFPVFPIYLALALGALEGLLGLAASHWSMLAAAKSSAITVALTSAAVVCFGAAYFFGAAYLGLDREPIREGFLDPDFVQVAAFLRDQTQPADTILFRKPRLLALETRRHALTYALAPGLGDFVQDVRPSYIVVTESPQVGLASDEQFLWPYIRNHEDALRLVYRNSEFRVYHVLE